MLKFDGDAVNGEASNGVGKALKATEERYGDGDALNDDEKILKQQTGDMGRWKGVQEQRRLTMVIQKL